MALESENSMAKSAMYNMIAKFGQMVIQLIIQMVLARLINASDYGVVAILTVAINFLNMFADLGLGVSIIQRDNLQSKKLNGLFTSSLYIGVVLMVIMMIIGFPASLIYTNSAYKHLFLIASIVALFNALNVVPNALLMRRKRFDLIAWRSIIVNLIAGICAIIAAFNGWSYYALVLNYIIAALGLFCWNIYSNREYKLRFTRHVVFKEIVGFLGKYSLFQFMFNVLNYFTRNLDYMLIGAHMDSATLGYYQKAYTLNLYPNQLFTNVISSVFHPYMKALKDKPKELYLKWIDITENLSIIASFVMSMMFVASYEIINIMFGSNWGVSVGCLHWLSICVWAQMLSSTCGAVFLSVERTDQTFKLGIINVLIILVAVVGGLFTKNISMLSLFIGISYNVIFGITVLMVARTLQQSIWIFAKQVLPDLVGAVIWMIAMSYISLNISNPIMSIIVKFLLTIVFYLIFLCVTRRFKRVMRMLTKVMKSAIKR